MIDLISVLDRPGVSIPLLYKLLQERPPEANISHRGMPTMDAHREFVAHHPYAAWYLIMSHAHLGSPSVGAIYLTQRAEIGIGVLEGYRRAGVAQAAIKALMAKHPRPHYYANVAPMNQASHNLFQGIGGELVQLTYKISKP